MQDSNFRARVAQAFDLGFGAAAAQPSGEAARYIASLSQIAQRSGDAGVARVFDNLNGFYSGTANRRDLFSGEEAGLATWIDNGPGRAGVPNGNAGEIADRTNIRIWLNPTGGGSAGLEMPDGQRVATFGGLVNKAWHELALHGLSKEHHSNPQTYEPNDPFMQRVEALAREFPRQAFDPLFQTEIDLRRENWSLGGPSFESINQGIVADASGAVDKRITVASDGIKTVTDYDQANASATLASTTTRYDAQGRVDWIDEQRDAAAGGGRVVTDPDQANASATIASTTTRYDGQNRIDSVTQELDAAAGGGRVHIEYDERNLDPVVTHTDTRTDAQGRTDYVEVWREDGTRTLTDHDERNAWVGIERVVTEFDAQGRPDTADRIEERGTGHVLIDYDQANANALVERLHTRFDARGRIDYHDEWRDDGSHRLTDYDELKLSPTILKTTTLVDRFGNTDWIEQALERTEEGRSVADGRLLIDRDQASNKPWNELLTRYDAQNRVDWIEKRWDGGQVVDKVDRDQTATQAWTEIHTIENAGRVDKQTVDWDNQRQTMTDWNLTGARINGMLWTQTVTDFDLARREDYAVTSWSDGRSTVRDTDLTGQQIWSVLTTERDAEGHDDTALGLLRAGGRWQVDYDQRDRSPEWDLRETVTAPDGSTLDYERTVYDNGRTVTTDNDQVGDQLWRHIETTREADGTISSETTRFDDGRGVEFLNDVADQHAWQTHYHYVDAAGRTTQVVAWYDPESSVRYYEANRDTQNFVVSEVLRYNDHTDIVHHDPHDAQAWTRVVDAYNSNGEQTVKWVSYPDHQYWQNFDRSGQAWTTYTIETYNAPTAADPFGRGEVYSETTVYDPASGGHTDVVRHDVVNAFTWDHSLDSYSAAGHHTTRIETLGGNGNFFSGERQQWTYDAANADPVISGTFNRFDPANQLDFQTITKDNGRRTEQDWDLRNETDFVWQLRYYDAQGRHDETGAVFDRGPFAGLTYWTDYDELGNDIFDNVGHAPDAVDCTIIYDGAGRLFARQIHWQNGAYTDRTFDPLNRDPWDSKITVYNSVGQISSSVYLDEYGATLGFTADSNGFRFRISFDVDFW